MSEKAARKVVKVSLGDIRDGVPFRARNIVYTSDKRRGEHLCWITTWQDWCKSNKASVVAVGND